MNYTSPEQCRASLATANHVRLNGAALRREVRAGLPLSDALYDPRAGSLTVYALLTARHGWGRARAMRILNAYHVSEGRRVRELTDRQRRALAQDLALCALCGRPVTA